MREAQGTNWQDTLLGGYRVLSTESPADGIEDCNLSNNEVNVYCSCKKEVGTQIANTVQYNQVYQLYLPVQHKMHCQTTGFIISSY